MPKVELELDVGDMSDDELSSRIGYLAELIIDRVQDYVRQYDLIVSSEYLQGWFWSYEDGFLEIDNRASYAKYLEFGTYDYYTQYGDDNFPENPLPKKKDLPRKLRRMMQKGMKPFAPVRRVLYNPVIMGKLATQAFS